MQTLSVEHGQIDPSNRKRRLPVLQKRNQNSPSTMDKPLDTADAPGLADSEIGDDEHIGEVTGRSDSAKTRRAGS